MCVDHIHRDKEYQSGFDVDECPECECQSVYALSKGAALAAQQTFVSALLVRRRRLCTHCAHACRSLALRRQPTDNALRKVLGARADFAGNGPDFVIAGAQKAGTTTLFAHLMGDPHLTSASVGASADDKELHFFDQCMGATMPRSVDAMRLAQEDPSGGAYSCGFYVGAK